MGTWDIGPFDNDSAADWCGDLEDATPALRPAMVRSAFTAVLDNGDDYLDSDLAVDAIAAAAIVASQLPGGAAITSPYAPEFLLDGGSIDVAGDVPALAVRALDRIVGDDSEWHELWAETEEEAPALAVVHQLRASIDAAVTQL
ncbi:DUF4259 domain-containing protein [Actinoplanes sp. KI2]|uniref:DUF4259 domain-containing protein n=1 Tax=Actinoplanes sp. KI2 TaxID=2983315 RepID=UPI0021D5AA43|nr:DUF4259 domain-containing protein [Actinoplanes sp. KI2]MCU7725696.1 DUF4259 domain-containing protein [Actinoplanes sp. KI2]